MPVKELAKPSRARVTRQLVQLESKPIGADPVELVGFVDRGFEVTRRKPSGEVHERQRGAG
jgi:hypothetical protein